MEQVKSGRRIRQASSPGLKGEWGNKLKDQLSRKKIGRAMLVDSWKNVASQGASRSQDLDVAPAPSRAAPTTNWRQPLQTSQPRRVFKTKQQALSATCDPLAAR